MGKKDPPINDARLQKWREFCLKHGLEPRTGLVRALDRALTSRPYARRFGLAHDNYWQEWVGDAVWADQVAHFLATDFSRDVPLERLETLRVHLCGATLQIRMALRLGLDHLLLVPDDYSSSRRGRKQEDRGVLLGNAFEAVIAAIYSKHPEALADFVRRCLEPALESFVFGDDDLPNLWRDIAPFQPPKTRTEWVGIFVARMVVTARIKERQSGCHAAQGHTLRETIIARLPRNLALTARAMELCESDEEDLVGTRRLLAVFGHVHDQPDYLTLVREHALAQEIDALLTEAGISLRETRERWVPTHLAELKTFLNGSPHPLVVERVGEKTTIFCDGVELGSASSADDREAVDQAALAALNHNELPRLRGEFLRPKH